MNNYPTQAEYNSLLAQLRNLTLEELILLYVGAKTTTQEDSVQGFLETVQNVGELPVEILEAMGNLHEKLNNYQRVHIKSLT